LRRPGTTLIEQLIGLSLLGLLFTITLHGVGTLRDRLALRAAREAVRDTLALAREQAIAAGRRVAVHIDRRAARLVVHAGADSLHRVPVGGLWGVTLDASRDSTAYGPAGLGVGAANLSLVLRRGALAETVTVSRLGRVR
jgi:Tfp pilus assembly protein FimT